MKNEQAKKKVGKATALAIAILSLGAFTGMASIVAKNQSLITPVTLADDNEDKSNDSEDKNKDEQKSEENKQEKTKESSKKQYEQDREKNKQVSEKNREQEKKNLEQNREQNKQEEDNKDGEEMDADGDYDGDESADTDTDGDRVGDTKGMYKDSGKTLTKLQENISEAEKKILEKQAEGVDVADALKNLAVAKAQFSQVSVLFDQNDYETAKQLAKNIKKENIFNEKDLEFQKDVAESVREVTKKIAKVNEKIAILESLGGDTTAFKTQIVGLQADLTVLQSSTDMTREAFKVIEKKAKKLKNLVEQSIFALGGSDEDDDLYADHEEDTNDLEEDLKDVAEIEDGDENGVSEKVRSIAKEHRSSVATVANSLGDIKNQSSFTKTVFGPDFNALDKLTSESDAMVTRADNLITVSTQVTDPDVKQVLIDRAAALRSEASKLSAYISAENSQFSIFGKLLSFFR